MRLNLFVLDVLPWLWEWSSGFGGFEKSGNYSKESCLGCVPGFLKNWGLNSYAIRFNSHWSLKISWPSLRWLYHCSKFYSPCKWRPERGQADLQARLCAHGATLEDAVAQGGMRPPYTRNRPQALLPLLGTAVPKLRRQLIFLYGRNFFSNSSAYPQEGGFIWDSFVGLISVFFMKKLRVFLT